LRGAALVRIIDDAMAAALRAVARSGRGVARAVRACPGTFAAAAAATLVLSIELPPLVLSLARTPVDYFTFNPWLKRLPDYLASPAVPLDLKVAKLPDLALFWFSSDSPYGGTEWGFAVDVRDLARITATALLVGAWIALWVHGRTRAALAGWSARVGRQGGVAGALVTIVGLSTGPCSVMGCGAPVLPVVGLAFAGMSSGTLALFATLATISMRLVLVVLVAGVASLGWIVGRDP
jgi:hypothetical protein